MKNKKIALFIPTFNVEKTVVKVLREIPCEVLEEIEKVYIIDNGSSDSTQDLIKDFVAQRADANKFEAYQNEKNLSLGGSTIHAFERSERDGIDHLICMHSDGQASPLDLNLFVKNLKDSDFDFVLGNRFDKRSQVGKYSSVRLFFNIVFAHLQQLIIKQRVYDIGAFIAFKISTVKKVDYKRVPHDMGYHPYLILVICRLVREKIHFCEFPIYWGEVGHTNINIYRYGLKHLCRIFFLILGHVFYAKDKLENVEGKKI